MLFKKLLLAGLYIMLLVVVSGCGNDENPAIDSFSVTEDTDWQIIIIDDVPIATFEDGSVIEGWNAYQAKVKTRVNAFDLEGLSLSVEQWPSTTTEAELIGGGFPVLRYYIRFSAESNYLGGCIGRRVPHLGVSISRQGVRTPIVDMHVATWMENGKLCAGVYNSGNRGYFCVKICSPSYFDVRNALRSAILAAGIGYIMASIIATAITPVVYLLVF